ncbi:MAG: VanZ family protein [Gammaproteobacteria bacterium]
MNGIGTGFRRAWQGLILLLACAIAGGSLLSLPTLEPAAGIDKLEHFAAYLALALLGSGIVERARLWVVMARCFVFGVAIEALQAVGSAGRMADWTDVAANGAGILVAWWIAGGGRAGWARHVEAGLRRRAPP